MIAHFHGAGWALGPMNLFYPRPFGLRPPGDGALVALDRVALGLLVAPAQRRQYLPDVARMVVNAELLVDQLGHSRQRPRDRSSSPPGADLARAAGRAGPSGAQTTPAVGQAS